MALRERGTCFPFEMENFVSPSFFFLSSSLMGKILPIKSRYISPTTQELVLCTRLASSSQQPSCLCTLLMLG